MSAATVETAVQASTDQIGAIRSAYIATMSTRAANALWDLSYAAHDVPYDNRMLNASLSGVDVAVNTASIGNAIFAPWVNLNNAYFSLDAGLTYNGSAVSSLKGAIEDVYRWRVGQYFNQVMLEVAGNAATAIALRNVFPRPDLVLGSYAATGASTGTFTAGAATDPARSGPGTVGAYVTSTIGGSNLVLALTCKFEDGTTISVPLTVPTTSAVGVKVLAGKTPIATCNATTGVIALSSTSLFKIGQKVLVVDGTLPASEVADVLAISAGVSITLTKSGTITPGLRNSFTLAGFVYPQFTAVTAVTNSNGTSADAVQFRFEPDRVQAIG